MTIPKDFSDALAASSLSTEDKAAVAELVDDAPRTPRRARELSGLSLGQAALLLGIDRQKLMMLELGGCNHVDPPGPELLSQMETLYGCKVTRDG